MFIELTGTGGASTNLIVPANKKLYFIYNNTSSGQVTVKVAGQTGVSVPNGKKMVLVCNGTDIVNGLNYIADFGTNSFTVTNLTATSATITTLTSTSAGITTLSGTSANITTLSGTNFSATSLTLTNALGVAQGGTGNTAAPSAGQLLVGNGTGFTLNTLNGGPGVGITNAAGSITITATGTGFIASVNATSPLQSVGTQSITISIASSTGSGAVVLATNPTISSLTLTSSLKPAQGGTGVTSTPTNGQLLIGNGSGFALSALTAGTGVSITNSAGSISISATASTGDITFTSAVISTANTNQNMVLDPNGDGKVLINTASQISTYGSNTLLQLRGSTGTNVYPMLIETQQYPRPPLILWNNHSTGRGSNNAQYVWFSLDSTEDFVGSITYNNSAGQINYNQTSDRRIKTIYGPTTNSGQLIDGLKVYDGKMDLGTLTYPMMIADEIQQVAPYCVTGQPNAVDDEGKPIYQQVDYSSMVPLLIAELQSLRARVAELEAKA
jgi:hypothetical protein